MLLESLMHSNMQKREKLMSRGNSTRDQTMAESFDMTDDNKEIDSFENRLGPVCHKVSKFAGIRLENTLREQNLRSESLTPLSM